MKNLLLKLLKVTPHGLCNKINIYCLHMYNIYIQFKIYVSNLTNHIPSELRMLNFEDKAVFIYFCQKYP